MTPKILFAVGQASAPFPAATMTSKILFAAGQASASFMQRP
jgi:hypothetical protein